MEHSALHGLLLTGLILALGGPLAVFWLFFPALRQVRGVDANRILNCVAKWTAYGALASAFATFCDLFVQVAEVQGQTVFGGVELVLVWKFATLTTVGRLSVLRLVLLLVTAAATRTPGKLKWIATGMFALASVIATALVSHAAAQPGNQFPALIIQALHIVAVAMWMGVLLQIFLGRKLLLAGDNLAMRGVVANVVRRFAPYALGATALLGITGATAAYRYMQDAGALFTSPYGLTLIVKLVLLMPAIYAGYINFRVVGPALQAEANQPQKPSANSALSRFRKTLELEITSGILVITVAGILASVSPPGDDGSARLTAAQASAVITPHLPRSHVENWTEPDDPRGPTESDLHYSEFTHNWSGVVVIFLGLAWLAQAAGGKAATWGTRASALILVPFGGFIALAANPELWLLHHVSPWEAISNPVLLEHQLGAVMVFVIAWLTWRDRKNPEAMRPLGYPLPAIMIVGSLLLLGHAHSTVNITDELTNLINTQHAVFGALGLFAGTTRLLVLRGLLPGRLPRYAWASFVVGLGLFMAFVYRETLVF
jgi:putative copper export protein